MMAAWPPASAGPQDDPTVPPVAITPGGGGFVADDERTYWATLTLAGALADQTLESGQAAQALAAAAAARQAARSDTDSPAADGSAVSTAAPIPHGDRASDPTSRGGLPSSDAISRLLSPNRHFGTTGLMRLRL